MVRADDKPQFIYGPAEVLPSLGKVELAWVNNSVGANQPSSFDAPPPPPLSSSRHHQTRPSGGTDSTIKTQPYKSSTNKPHRTDDGGGVDVMQDGNHGQSAATTGMNEDYDVADDDDDRWMVE